MQSSISCICYSISRIIYSPPIGGSVPPWTHTLTSWRMPRWMQILPPLIIALDIIVTPCSTVSMHTNGQYLWKIIYSTLYMLHIHPLPLSVFPCTSLSKKKKKYRSVKYGRFCLHWKRIYNPTNQWEQQNIYNTRRMESCKVEKTLLSLFWVSIILCERETYRICRSFVI